MIFFKLYSSHYNYFIVRNKNHDDAFNELYIPFVKNPGANYTLAAPIRISLYLFTMHSNVSHVPLPVSLL